MDAGNSECAYTKRCWIALPTMRTFWTPAHSRISSAERWTDRKTSEETKWLWKCRSHSFDDCSYVYRSDPYPDLKPTTMGWAEFSCQTRLEETLSVNRSGDMLEGSNTQLRFHLSCGRHPGRIWKNRSIRHPDWSRPSLATCSVTVVQLQAWVAGVRAKAAQASSAKPYRRRTVEKEVPHELAIRRFFATLSRLGDRFSLGCLETQTASVIYDSSYLHF